MTDITTTLTYTADLTRPLRRMNIPALFITDARRAHRITVTVLRAGNPVDLGDTAVSGTVKHLRTGTTIPLSGSAQGSIASVTLPPAAYAQPGDIEIYVTPDQRRRAELHFRRNGLRFPLFHRPRGGCSRFLLACGAAGAFSSLDARLRALEEIGIPVTTADQLVSTQALDSWKFSLISATANTAYASTAEAAPSYDDASWRTVSVPHDWSVELAFNSSSPATYEGGYLDGGDAWYRTTVSVDKQHGRRYVLCFDGVYMESTVYVNGQQVHKNYYGYNPFAVDATEQMVSGVNTIAVFVRNAQPSSRWYSGSGLIRPVELVTLLDDQIRMENIRVTTPKLDSDLTNGETVVAFDAVNRTGAEASATFTVDLYDPDGAKVGTADASAVIAAGETQNVSATVAYRSPKLWHINDAQQREAVANGKSVSASGNPLTCENALAGKPLGALRVWGKSTQNGLPTPTAPVPIVSAGDGGTVVVTVSDGVNESQTLTLQTPNALPGIPVTSGGNYTDENGQQWVCDEVDLARGVRVQHITKIKLTSSMNWQTANSKRVDRYFASFKGIDMAGILCTHFSFSTDAEVVGGIGANLGNIGFAYAEKGHDDCFRLQSIP